MKTTMKLFAGLIALAIIAGAGTKLMAVNASSEKVPATMNVVEIAVADERFSILVEAVGKAGLVDALSAEGPYTVFAPTNEAFEMLFKELGVSGVDDLTAGQLTPILLYHVLGAKVMAADVKSGKVETLNEDAWLMIDAGQSGVTLNGTSKVVITDVEGSNGVIHVIDKVLVPETKLSQSKNGCN
jgi:transforming growth factor-beta-induced protein